MENTWHMWQVLSWNLKRPTTTTTTAATTATATANSNSSNSSNSNNSNNSSNSNNQKRYQHMLWSILITLSMYNMGVFQMVKALFWYSWCFWSNLLVFPPAKNHPCAVQTAVLFLRPRLEHSQSRHRRGPQNGRPWEAVALQASVSRRGLVESLPKDSCPFEPLVASLLLVLVAMPGAPSSFLFLVVRPGALVASLLLVAMPGAPSSFLFLDLFWCRLVKGK